MNTNKTVEKMNQMRLIGMSRLYDQSIKNNLHTELTSDELVGTLVDGEWEYRYNRKISNLITRAGFKAAISHQDIDYASNRNLDKGAFHRLLSLRFVEQKENIIITGPTGVGKSYLTQAIGMAACQMDISVRYFNFAQFCHAVQLGHVEGSYLKLLKSIAKAQVLIVDDFGLHPFDNQSRQAFMDIIEDRYDRASTIIAAQIPVKQWHETIGEGTIADAILDRLVYSSHRVELQGQSLRKNKKLVG
jgi:DNA replication protein DnaC